MSASNHLAAPKRAPVTNHRIPLSEGDAKRRHEFISRARDMGWTWERIGMALELAPMAARKWFYRSGAPVEARTRTKRKCLGCQQPFDSEGIHNRMCRACATSGYSPYEPGGAGNTGRRKQPL